MYGDDDETEEPKDASSESSERNALQPKKRRQSFGKVRRELTEEELDSSGVQKMLLDEVDRLEGAEIELKSTSEKFHQVNTKHEVAKQRIETHRAFEIISTGTVAIGSVLFSVAFQWKNYNTLFWFLIATGFALIMIGIIAKAVRG